MATEEDVGAVAADGSEARLARANRALRVLSAGNRALLHAKDEDDLAREMCRVIVDAGGYPMAWVGYLGADGCVRPMASWGAEPGYLEALGVVCDGPVSARGPTATAVRRGVAVAANRIPQTDANCGPWRKQAQRFGYPALLALPLRIDGRVIGALTICGAEDDAFDGEVVELFGEAAADLAFGVASQRAQAEAARMRAEVDRHRCHLEELVRQLRQMAMDATLAEERERQAIARDLHDDLGQILHVAKIKLDALEAAAPAAAERVREIDRLVADASARVRSLTSQLSPPVLATLGLVPALSWLAGEMQRSYGLAVEVEAEDDGAAGKLTVAQSAILFRAARELLINIAKHAGVASAYVDVYPEGGALVVRVTDEGRGIADLTHALAGRQGFGLASVRERIAYLAGSVDIATTPGAGTAVTLRMPYDCARKKP